MTRLRQTIAKRLKGAQEEAALLTTFNDVDMTAVIEAREQVQGPVRQEARHQARLHELLRQGRVPGAEGRAVGQRLDRGRRDRLSRLRRHLGRGQRAQRPGRAGGARCRHRRASPQIELAIADFGKRAKDGTLTMEDMKGGTFTISNGGVFGSLMSTPIINPPQSAGARPAPHRGPPGGGQRRGGDPPDDVHRAVSYDHRLIDGREAVTALKIIKEAIEDPTCGC